tara:strand:+ start:54 stop:494 length:441 start_codon:yes stop_codon:yes gene_type:complete
MDNINKNLPERFTRAIEKLYTAFHKGTLNPSRCSACAVGNIVGHGKWHFSSPNKILIDGDMTYIKDIELNDSQYSADELALVERFFVFGFKDGCKDYHLINSKENQFKGLCNVVEYLCQLDGIPNVMDFSKLFETNKDNKAKYELI